MSRKAKPSIFFKGKTWYIRFQKDGKRVKRSCQTEIENDAKKLIPQIELLLLDENAPTSSLALEVFTGEKPAMSSVEAAKRIKKLNTPSQTDEYLMMALSVRVGELEAELERVAPYETKYLSLMQNMEAKQIEAFNSLPAFRIAFDQYKKHVSHLDQKGVLHTRLLKKLFDHFDCWAVKISELEPKHIYQFLEKDSQGGKDPSERWNRRRRSLHRFWKWLGVNFNIVNIILNVETKKQKIKTAEIHWHDIEDVEKEICEKNPYWSAVIATMAYSGLSAHEVRGLNLSDYAGGFLVVKGSKTASRPRKVAVHEFHLKPRLDEYLEFKKEDKHIKDSAWFFPSTTYGSEQWQMHSFSRNLNKRINQYDMNALSLRRTFGSLLLRSGKSESEVAAAMGNSPVMVRKHYAKLLGGEVDINF